MNKGFSYLNLIVAIVVFLSIFTALGSSFFYFEKQTTQLRSNYKLISDVNITLNKISFELKSGKVINSYDFPTNTNHLSFINIHNKRYTIQERNNRLAKRSKSTTYLTEKSIQITDFRITKRSNSCYNISFKATKNNHFIIFKRSIKVINV